MLLAGEQEVRARLDPMAFLPELSVYRESVDPTDVVAYHLYDAEHTVGMMLMRFAQSEVGGGTAKIESIDMRGEEDPDFRRAAMVTAFILTNSARLTLVSDEYGNTFDEVGMWTWFRDAGIAVITRQFELRLRPRLSRGEAIYDGSAFARPLH